MARLRPLEGMGVKTVGLWSTTQCTTVHELDEIAPFLRVHAPDLECPWPKSVIYADTTRGVFFQREYALLRVGAQDLLLQVGEIEEVRTPIVLYYHPNTLSAVRTLFEYGLSRGDS